MPPTGGQLELNGHWGVAALRNAGVRVNTLGLVAMARAAPNAWQDLWPHSLRRGPGMRCGHWFIAGPLEIPLEAFLVSTGVVALGEMGDKTQLLAIVLAAMFRRPWPIVAGILVATLANHTAAGALGGWVAQALGPDLLRWVIGLSLLAMAGWMLIPDKIDDDAAGGR